MPDRIQMIAEMIDKSVGPNAKKIEKALTDLSKVSARDLPVAFKKYQNAVQTQEKALRSFTKGSEGVRREVEAFKKVVERTFPTVSELTKSVGAFALGSGAAVGAVAAIGAALYEAGRSALEFSESMKKIKFGSAETGLGQLQIKQLIQALDEFDIDADTAMKGFEGLRKNMTDMVHHTALFRDKIDKLGNEIARYSNPVIAVAQAGGTTAQVYKEINKQLDRISADHTEDPALAQDIRRRFAEAMGLTPEFGKVGEAALKEKGEIIKTLGTTKEEMKDAIEAAEKFNKLWEDTLPGIDKWLMNLDVFIIKTLLGVEKVMDRLKDTLGVSKIRQLGILLGPLTGGATNTFSAAMDAWQRSHGLTPFATGGSVTRPTAALIGEAGPEFVVSERGGRLITKPTIAMLGVNGPEHVMPAARFGPGDEDPNVSGALDKINAYKNAYKRSEQDQWAEYKQFMGQMGSLMPNADWAKFEREARPSTNIEDFRRGHPATSEDTASGRSRGHKKTFNAPQDRRSLNATMGGGIQSDGQLDVHVRAPQGTRVKAEGGGIFQKTNLRRNIQMPTAEGGPLQVAPFQ